MLTIAARPLAGHPAPGGGLRHQPGAAQVGVDDGVPVLDSGISSAGLTIEIPALLTTMSMGPSARSTASKAAAIDSADCTSSSTASPPCAVASSSACSDARRSAAPRREHDGRARRASIARNARQAPTTRR